MLLVWWCCTCELSGRLVIRGDSYLAALLVCMVVGAMAVLGVHMRRVSVVGGHVCACVELLGVLG